MLKKFDGNDFRRTKGAIAQRDAIHARHTGLETLGAPTNAEKLEAKPTAELFNSITPKF